MIVLDTIEHSFRGQVHSSSSITEIVLADLSIFLLKLFRWLLLDMIRFHYLGQTNKCRRVDKVDINMQITGEKIAVMEEEE